jgi:hypothetical protein
MFIGLPGAACVYVSGGQFRRLRSFKCLFETTEQGRRHRAFRFVVFYNNEHGEIGLAGDRISALARSRTVLDHTGDHVACVTDELFDPFGERGDAREFFRVQGGFRGSGNR